MLTWLFVLGAASTRPSQRAAGLHGSSAARIAPDDPRQRPGSGPRPRLERRFGPLSNGLAIPVFAFFAAGVAVGGANGVMEPLTDPVAIGIVLSLVVGKLVGIFSGDWLMGRFTPVKRDNYYMRVALGGLAMIAGIGFTVSLLVAELSFGTGSPHNDYAKVGILTNTAIASLIGGCLLALRNAHYKKLRAQGLAVDKLYASS